MKRLAITVGIVLIISGCDGVVLIVSTGPTPPLVPSPTAHTSARDIAFGVAVFGTVTTTQPVQVFDVIAPTTGVLVVRVSWDVRTSGSQLLLRVGNTAFPGVRPDWSPIVGRVRVAKGDRCRLTVEAQDAGRISTDQFTLTTSLE